MTKKKSRGTLGRGQEEFTGNFSAAFEAAQARERRRTAAYREALDRAARAAPGRGPMRLWAVGWRVVAHSYETGSLVTEAMGRTVMVATSPTAVRARAPRWCLREAQRETFGREGFQIRYIKEVE